MANKQYSRREFIRRHALAGITVTAAGSMYSSLFSNAMPHQTSLQVKDSEPIIDIHQHTHYSGRSIGSKKIIVVALEILDSGVGRAYAEVIENASSKELGNFKEVCIKRCQDYF